MHTRVFVNPADDVAFALAVHDVVLGGAPTAEAAQAELRQWYPHAVVRERASTDEQKTWYVYRDSAWIGPSETADREA
jgi:hypothetical protein